jgi:exosome complex component RRP40
LLRPKSTVLVALGKHIQFEVTVGLNGRVWVNAPSAALTILAKSALIASEFMTERQIEAMVAEVVKKHAHNAHN